MEYRDFVPLCSSALLDSRHDSRAPGLHRQAGHLWALGNLCLQFSKEHVAFASHNRTALFTTWSIVTSTRYAVQRCWLLATRVDSLDCTGGSPLGWGQERHSTPRDVYLPWPSHETIFSAFAILLAKLTAGKRIFGHIPVEINQLRHWALGMHTRQCAGLAHGSYDVREQTGFAWAV
jgi:hypothetical protein